MDEMKESFEIVLIDGSKYDEEIPKYLSFRLVQRLRSILTKNTDGKGNPSNATVEDLGTMQESLIKYVLPRQKIDELSSETVDKLTEKYYEQIKPQFGKKKDNVNE